MSQTLESREAPTAPPIVPPVAPLPARTPGGTDAPTGTPLIDDVVATAALALFTVVVAAGFARVFSGWDFFDNLLVVAAVGHGVSLVLRRLRAPLWVSFPVVVAALAWLIGAIYYRETYSLLLPTSDTWTLFRFETSLVGEQFRTAVAPVEFLGGWDVVASIGVAAVVVLSDIFAFRAFARAEALVPGGVLFVFVAALGSDRSRIPLAAALVGAGVLVTAVLRAHHAPRRLVTIGSSRRMLLTALPAAAVTALVVAVAASAIGPRLPGADAEPLYETKGGRSGNVTEVVSPLVDIRSRLTNRSTVELFEIEATADSYWRSSALPQFDGTTWGLPERSLRRTDGALAPAPAGSVEIRQNITVRGLGGALLPAAPDPIAASGSDELRFNADSATLVKTGDELSFGDEFQIVSAAPRFSPEQLASATALEPGDPIYFELPDDFPSSVAVTTAQVLADARTPYEAALTLQTWFRSEFRYSLEIQEGHGNNAIEAFLRDRVGYCEQFAGTYAAMMRSVGIPARVAVGFTPGDNDGTGTYSVLGRNAHAWPEVWFDGLGWVPFEPTPGRGAPGAEGYTGLEAQQVEPLPPTDPSDGSNDGNVGNAPAPTAPPRVIEPDITQTTIAGDGAAPAPTPGGPTVDGAEAESGSVPWVLLGIIMLAAITILLPALARRFNRRSRGSADEELSRLWTRAINALADVGVELAPDLTPHEVAERAIEQFPTAGRPMRALADTITVATYADDGSEVLDRDGTYGVSLIGNCSVWCRQIEKAVHDSVAPVDRFRRHFLHWT